MSTMTGPRVLFPEGYDERADFETSLKGWLSAEVELEDGSRCDVYFSDPVRLQQDLDEALSSGRPCFAEPGLIVVPEVTAEVIENATRFLWRQGFFTHLQTCRNNASRPTETEQAPSPPDEPHRARPRARAERLTETR